MTTARLPPRTPTGDDPLAEPGVGELPIDADPPENRQEPARLGDIVARLLRRILPQQDPVFRSMVESWPAWAGNEMAACTRPGKVDRGTLFVYVSDSVRLAEVRRFHLQALEARVRRKAGPERIRSVRLLLDPGDKG